MNKYSTIRAVGQQLRMRNHEVQQVLEAVISLWSEELAHGGRIEIENFLVLEVKTIQRTADNLGTLMANGKRVVIPSKRQEIKVRPSKKLRARLKNTT